MTPIRSILSFDLAAMRACSGRGLTLKVDLTRFFHSFPQLRRDGVRIMILVVYVSVHTPYGFGV